MLPASHHVHKYSVAQNVLHVLNAQSWLPGNSGHSRVRRRQVPWRHSFSCRHSEDLGRHQKATFYSDTEGKGTELTLQTEWKKI